MKKILFLAVLFTTTILSKAQTDLIISEYIDGSGNNKALEIYNPTNAAITLTGKYYVARYSNGAADYAAGGITELTGTIGAYKTFVLTNGQTTGTASSPACDPRLLALADQPDHAYPAPTYMNGNDVIALLKKDGANYLPVDLFGQIGLGDVMKNALGWAPVQDSVVKYPKYIREQPSGNIIDTIQMQTTIKNYVVPTKADGGDSFVAFWMAWSKDHSLKRKPEVVAGIKVNPGNAATPNINMFNIGKEWTPVADTADNWTNLRKHACVADPSYVKVAEVKPATMVRVFPNPASQWLYVQTGDALQSALVFDLAGRETKAWTVSDSYNSATLDIAHLPEGVYLLRLTMKNGNVQTEKFIISKR